MNQSYNGRDLVEIEIKIVSTTQSRSEHSQRLSFSPKFVQRVSKTYSVCRTCVCESLADED